MANGGDYPFKKEQQLFEQNGWLKAEIEALKKTQLTEADLLKFEVRLIEKWKQSLDAWWLYKPRELNEMIDERLDKRRDDEERLRLRVLEEQGLELGPDGKPKSKVNPVRAFLLRHWTTPILIIAFIAIAKPEWLGAAIGFIRMFT